MESGLSGRDNQPAVWPAQSLLPVASSARTVGSVPRGEDVGRCDQAIDVTIQLKLSAMLIAAALMVACTDDGLADPVFDEPPPTAEAHRAEVIEVDGSPVQVLIEGDVAEVVAAGETESCIDLDATAIEGVDGSDFLIELDAFARAHPTAGANLRSEITAVALVLGACADGSPVAAEDRERFDEIVARWQEELA